MAEVYHIIRIADYKGGELVTYFNLDYETFLLELAEILGLYLFIDEALDEEIIPEGDYEAQRELLRGPTLLKWIKNSRSLYGDGDYCWFIYESKNDYILELELTQGLLDDIVELYIKREYL